MEIYSKEYFDSVMTRATYWDKRYDKMPGDFGPPERSNGPNVIAGDELETICAWEQLKEETIF